ncbi:MAG: glycosyltransferase family 2 protein [Candidatus Sungbacteria bacterium]|nr:glycosyltransferase family 2 protein [bacterium]MDZ4260411.1 glycosyltransferase family 2 protein [Candidatus Sungbacteria bacterium]
MIFWYICWGITVAVGVRYLIWLKAILEWDYWFLAGPFFIAECWILGFFAISNFIRLCTLIQGGRRRNSTIGVQGFPIVLALVPVCGEPVEEVRKTVFSLLALRYPRDKIYVAITDDCGNPELLALADEWGVGYVTHPRHTEAKAGNLNRALGQLRDAVKPEWILVVDTGDSVIPEAMDHARPYMDEERLGFMQFERHFTFGGAELPSDFRYFYEVIQPRRNNVGSAFACGSGALWNIKAIDELGGFSTWNIVEDVTTSYLLQLKGWRGRYIYGKAFHCSEYVSDMSRLMKQRWQWMIDTYRLFFWKNPFLQKSFSFVLRWDYAEIGFAYLLGFPILTARLMPFFLTWLSMHLFKDQGGVIAYWYFFLPLMFGRIFCEYVELKKGGVPFRYWKKQLTLFEGLLPVFCLAAIQTLIYGPNRKPKYRTTGKAQLQGFFWRSIKFQLLLYFGGIGTICYGYMMAREVTPSLVTNALWLLYSSWVLLPFITAAAVTSSRAFRLTWRWIVIGSLCFGIAILLNELYLSPTYSWAGNMILVYMKGIFS